MNYYIYYRSGRDVMYDRSIPPCTCPRRPELWAEERVQELRRRGKDAWWCTDVLRHAFY